MCACLAASLYRKCGKYRNQGVSVMVKVLFVCLGNICRSATAEAVLRLVCSEFDRHLEIDSAGTAAFHIGKSPDKRSQTAAKARGIDMSRLKARQVSTQDFYEFDFIFAMDESNFSDLKYIQPIDAKAKLDLFLSKYGSLGKCDVPDPYYGDSDGFEHVLDLLDDACRNFLKDEILVHEN